MVRLRAAKVACRFLHNRRDLALRQGTRLTQDGAEPGRSEFVDDGNILSHRWVLSLLRSFRYPLHQGAGHSLQTQLGRTVMNVHSGMRLMSGVCLPKL